MPARLVPISLGTTSNPGRHGPEGVARLINCYVEQLGEQGKHGWPVYVIDGLAPFATFTSSDDGVRALAVTSSTLYAVCGRQVYAVDLAGTATLLGSIATDGLTTMAVNRRQPNPQIAIVCGGEYWIVENNILTRISDPDLPPPLAVLEMDGYFIFPTQAGSGRFYISALNDGSIIDGLDFASAEASSDPLLIGATRGRDLCLFGTRSVEFWQNTGGADFPFARLQALNIGCFAAGSVTELTALINGVTVDSIAWAATDEKGGYAGVMLLSGYGAQKISTHEIDRLVRNDPAPAAIRGYAYSRSGHVFYSLAGAAWTRVYDTVTGTWHDEASYGSARRRLSCHAHFAGMDIVGAADDPKLYRVAGDVYDEAGQPIVATIQTPPVHAEPFPLQFHALHVSAIVDDNQQSWAHGTQPELMVDWSDDGGAHWSTQRRIVLGSQGGRLRRAVTRRLGVSRTGRTFRLSWSDGRIRGIMAAAAETEQWRV
jgi:hypothetical protein